MTRPKKTEKVLQKEARKGSIGNPIQLAEAIAWADGELQKLQQRYQEESPSADSSEELQEFLQRIQQHIPGPEVALPLEQAVEAIRLRREIRHLRESLIGSDNP